jgi:hypothetical protein
LKLLKTKTKQSTIKEKIKSAALTFKHWNKVKELHVTIKMINNVSLFFSGSHRYISEIILFMFRLFTQLKSSKTDFEIFVLD